MKKLSLTLLSALLVICAPAHARDDVDTYNIKSAMATIDAKTSMPGVSFYFGDKKPRGKVKKNHGEFRTNKKTNAFNKTDEEACVHAFHSALKALYGRAKKLGGNAVINIKSNYKNNEVSDRTNFRCGAGTFVAGVALKGTVVKLK